MQFLFPAHNKRFPFQHLHARHSARETRQGSRGNEDVRYRTFAFFGEGVQEFGSGSGFQSEEGGGEKLRNGEKGVDGLVLEHRYALGDRARVYRELVRMLLGRILLEGGSSDTVAEAKLAISSPKLRLCSPHFKSSSSPLNPLFNSSTRSSPPRPLNPPPPQIPSHSQATLPLASLSF